MRPMLRILIAAAITLCACAESRATLVKWTLNHASFFEGGSASGFFIVDTATGGSPDFEITTTDGLILKGHQYNSQLLPPSTDVTVEGEDFDIVIFGAFGTGNLHLATNADLLHTAGGTFPLLVCKPELPCPSFESLSFFHDNGFRAFESGALTASVIPEASSLAFLGVAAGLLVSVASGLVPKVTQRRSVQVLHKSATRWMESFVLAWRSS
jgi:hypothetical protein